MLLAAASTVAWALTPEQEAENAYQQALQAQQMQLWAEAELHYERVLMFNPDHAEARIQLALLLAKRGQVDSAVAFLQTLVEDPRTPSAHRQSLQALILQMQSTVAHPNELPATSPNQQPKPIVQARFGLGYSSNPFAQADISTLTVSLPQGNLELGLNPQIEPAAILQSSLYYQAPNQCGFELHDQRKKTLNRIANQKVLLFCYGTAWQEAFQSFVSSAHNTEGNQRAELGIHWLREQWRMTGQIYQETDLNREGFTLRADYLHTAADWRTLFFLEAEHNSRGALPGYTKTGIYTEYSYSNNISILSQWVLQRDTAGYSPLLNSGERRTLATAEIGLQKQWGRYAGWDTSSTVYASRRWSNIPLFEYKDLTLQLNIKRLF
jgi:tetratricopeptide (TPR) repeat protein